MITGKLSIKITKLDSFCLTTSSSFAC